MVLARSTLTFSASAASIEKLHTCSPHAVLKTTVYSHLLLNKTSNFFG